MLLYGNLDAQKSEDIRLLYSLKSECLKLVNFVEKRHFSCSIVIIVTGTFQYYNSGMELVLVWASARFPL